MKDNQWLITGVEDGWIKVGRRTWIEYLKAKRELEMNSGGHKS